MPLQWRNQLWRSLEEGAGERCSECDVALSGVTSCGRVWRKVSESDARSVGTLPWDVQSEPRFLALFLQEGAMHWPLSLQLAAI